MTRKKEKVNYLSIFKGFYLKFEVKILQIHKHGWLSITWILKKIELHKSPAWRHSRNQTLLLVLSEQNL